MKQNISRKEIVKRVKEIAAPIKTKNVTIKAPEALMEKFEKICNAEGISRNAALIELIKGFVAGS